MEKNGQTNKQTTILQTNKSNKTNKQNKCQQSEQFQNLIEHFYKKWKNRYPLLHIYMTVQFSTLVQALRSNVAMLN
jgi:hypothetical protein